MSDTWVLITAIYFIGFFVMPWFAAICVKTGAMNGDVGADDVLMLSVFWPFAFPIFAIALIFIKAYRK